MTSAYGCTPEAVRSQNKAELLADIIVAMKGSKRQPEAGLS